MVENNERDFKGIWIPKTIWLDKRLNALEKIILLEIDSLDKGEGCYASNEYLAEFCQCSVSKIKEAISKLKQYNYVYLKSFDGRLRFLGSRLSEKGYQPENIPQTDKKCTADSQNLATINIDNNIDINKEKKEISKEKKEFEDFWAMYPKQRAGSKAKALVAYLKVLKEKRATEEHLLAKVKEYANSREVREGFAKGCAAWLNDDRFNSDYNGGGNNGVGKDYNRENTGEYSGLGRKIG